MRCIILVCWKCYFNLKFTLRYNGSGLIIVDYENNYHKNILLHQAFFLYISRKSTEMRNSLVIQNRNIRI